jgi:TolB protein
MKNGKLIPVAILFIVFFSACTQPVNLSTWLAPSHETLREIFALFGAGTPQPEDSDKILETIPVAEEKTSELVLTDTPAVVALQAAAAELVPAQVSVTATPSENPTGKIIFTCQVDNDPGHDQICMINADGSGFKQLTYDMLHQHFYPSWAPDGSSFVFSGSHSGTFKIYEMDLESNMHIVGDVSGELYAPMISPDGTKIVFTRHISESEQYISVMDRDGGNVQNLTGYYDANDPVWSTDGSKIMFTSLQDGSQQIYFMNADGTTIQKINELDGLRGRPDWSVDFSIATYSGDKDEHNREIVLMELGGMPLNITSGGDNLSPAFSPDGQWITFMSYRDHFWEADGCEIYIMGKDGTDIRRLTDNTYCDYQPRWGK